MRCWRSSDRGASGGDDGEGGGEAQLLVGLEGELGQGQAASRLRLGTGKRMKVTLGILRRLRGWSGERPEVVGADGGGEEVDMVASLTVGLERAIQGRGALSVGQRPDIEGGDHENVHRNAGPERSSARRTLPSVRGSSQITTALPSMTRALPPAHRPQDADQQQDGQARRPELRGSLPGLPLARSGGA